MRVGVMGFGKAGRPVATTLLRNKDVILAWVVRRSARLDHRSVPEFLGEDSDEPGILHSSQTIGIAQLLDEEPVDVIIDFSSEDGLDYYAAEATRRGVTIITAISHYTDARVSELHEYARNTVVFWSPNITIGVNYLIIAAKYLKRLVPSIDMVVVEEHFREKPGVSGTARHMAEALDIDPGEIKSIRAGGIIGKHEIICGFPFQTVRLVHESITREAFGNGALFVARNLVGKPPGFYTFEALLEPQLA